MPFDAQNATSPGKEVVYRYGKYIGPGEKGTQSDIPAVHRYDYRDRPKMFEFKDGLASEPRHVDMLIARRELAERKPVITREELEANLAEIAAAKPAAKTL